MRAMVYHGQKQALKCETVERPKPEPHQILIKVSCCAVCRTDLHVVDAELPHPKLPLIPGHEIVGRIVEKGSAVRKFNIGDRIGIPWLGWTCGECSYCLNGRENLCPHARFTGYQIDGGYGEYTVADERFCFLLPSSYDDEKVAPLLCAGLIGYRTYAMAKEAHRIGIYGFGAAAHIIAQVCKYLGHEVYAFTRPGDIEAQQFAHEITGEWVGGSDEMPPKPLDAALIFAPVGALVPMALKVVVPGGMVVCGGIHMSDIPSFPYEWLWEERIIRSVANLTRKDAETFLALAEKIPIHIQTKAYSMLNANQALSDLRSGHLTGAAVLFPEW